MNQDTSLIKVDIPVLVSHHRSFCIRSCIMALRIILTAFIGYYIIIFVSFADINECSEQPTYCGQVAPILMALSCVHVNLASCLMTMDIPVNVVESSLQRVAVSVHLVGHIHTQANFECVWTIEVPNSDDIIQFTIDESAYGIKETHHVHDHTAFYDGMEDNAPVMDKLCKFDLPANPLTTTTSQGKVIFTGSAANRDFKTCECACHVHYSSTSSTDQ